MAGETTGVSGGATIQHQLHNAAGNGQVGPRTILAPGIGAGRLSEQPAPTRQQIDAARKAADKESANLSSRDANTRAQAIDRIMDAAKSQRAGWDAITRGRTAAQVNGLRNDYQAFTHARIQERMQEYMNQMGARPHVPTAGALQPPQ